jgi:transposase-like protein
MKINLQSLVDEGAALKGASTGNVGKFPDSFKQRAVSAFLGQQDLGVCQFAKEIGVSSSALRNWVVKRNKASPKSDLPVRIMRSAAKLPVVAEQLKERSLGITMSVAGIFVTFPPGTSASELVLFIRLIKEQVA